MKEIICDRTGIIMTVSIKGEVYINNILKHINFNRVYPAIELRKNNARRNHLVHLLVAELYLPKIFDKDFINHKDGNKHNFSLDNLEWCDHSENMKHAVRTGLLTNCLLKGENHNTSKHTFLEVVAIRNRYKTKRYSMRALAKEFNL